MSVIYVKVPSGKCHCTLLIVLIDQHWFTKWLGDIRQVLCSSCDCCNLWRCRNLFMKLSQFVIGVAICKGKCRNLWQRQNMHLNDIYLFNFYKHVVHSSYWYWYEAYLWHNCCFMTHVARCLSGSLTSGFLWSRRRGKRSRNFRRMRNPQFAYLVRGPLCRKNALSMIYLK